MTAHAGQHCCPRGGRRGERGRSGFEKIPVYFIKNEDMIISSRNKKKSKENIFLGSQNKILEERKINMMYRLSTSLHSFLASWEFYDIEDLTEEDFNKMIAVIRGQGLKEEVTGGCYKWYGTQEQILKAINAIEFSTHAGPSFEDYDDWMFDNIVQASLTQDEHRYRVHEVK